MTSSLQKKSPSPDASAPAAVPSALEPETDWRQAVELERRVVELQRRVVGPGKPKPTPPAAVETILSMARENPETRVRTILKEVSRKHGVTVSFTTVANILRKFGLQCGQRASMLREMEEAYLAGRPVTEWYCNRLLKENPALRERGRETSGPGERVCVTSIPVETPVGRVFAHAAVDTYGGVAVAEFYGKGTTEEAVDFLHERVLPFYRGREVRVASVETHRSRMYHGGGEGHVYAVYLRLQGIRYEVRRVGEPLMNGFMERFRQALTSGVIHPLLLELWNKHGRSAGGGNAVDAGLMARLQADLAKWILNYNEATPQEGYRNRGRTPLAFWLEGRR